ncbi:TylF/MycF/NovP-related O-methyltransferase [Metabacillus fastidiosus]|uniref:TylF/MycF/NovP-related O-methyltransferase n=1 Tax=Metabacillus fastidiosus TaxID=1458 RepID=UPI002DBC62F6|nr:TylF/MycF/NovP-related O-methyltransferase [Metabacillus fastidiosus]MEC2077306.1 TylF/MycF/NovP-related O-methyltransferase [Metabacillus fastidiosus]
MKIKVFLYGIGILSSSIEELIDQSTVEILGYIVDSQYKVTDTYNQRIVITPEEMKNNNIKYDYIIISSIHYDQMRNNLVQIGVSPQKIVGTDVFRSNTYSEFLKDVKEKYDCIFNQSVLNSLFKKKVYETVSLCHMNPSHRVRRMEVSDNDYVRYSTLELTCERIMENKVEGQLAELGVYRGDFASVINMLFPERKLFLFDTFEGFNSKDIELENEYGYSKNVSNQLSDTSIDIVIKKMKFPERCIIRKGYFPDTAKNIEDNFAFVSIDTDLYKPVYEGLKFFYPKLSKGGFIFVHDYLNRDFKGAKKAVDQFCREENITFSVMSDFYGTAIISK